MPTNKTHDPKLTSWIESANDPDTDFPIQNLPFGSFIRADEDELDARVGVAIGERILDLAAAEEEGIFEDLDDEEDNPLEEDLRGDLAMLVISGPQRWTRLRERISALLAEKSDLAKAHRQRVERCLVPMSEARLLRPLDVPNYTDFYASLFHATNVGSMFRPDNPLLPNYKHIPIAYHGRASTVIPSGQPVRRPRGQKAPPSEGGAPTFGPSKLLDYELEMGFIVGVGNDIGEPIPIQDAEDHVFGLCIVNDWSARDLQKWEYQPLGPFLAKSFATTVSPWVVTLEALAPFRAPAFERAPGDPQPLPYLTSDDNTASGAIDLTVEVHLASASMREKSIEPIRLSRASFKDMYWTIAQMLAHHASNGCAMEPGDLLASGTISGPTRDARGSMLELTWNGDPFADPPIKAAGTDRTPIELPTGERRTFLEDGDEVIIRAYAQRDGFRRIGLGECRAVITPALAE